MLTIIEIESFASLHRFHRIWLRAAVLAALLAAAVVCAISLTLKKLAS
jgi:hypothetical protein